MDGLILNPFRALDGRRRSAHNPNCRRSSCLKATDVQNQTTPLLFQTRVRQLPRRSAGGSRPCRAGKIILMGNPNVGKSVIFNHLTGAYATISNYPGTTVEISSGKANFQDGVVVFDSPGISGLTPRSDDENVSRQLLLERGDKIVVQVVDSKVLDRGLALTLQLIDAGVPLVLVLNMEDEAGRKGIFTDKDKLAHQLGLPVVATVAVKGWGIEDLKAKIPQARCSTLTYRYDDDLEEAIARVEPAMPESSLSKRSLATMFLSGDKYLEEWLAGRLPAGELARLRVVAGSLQSSRAQPTATRISLIRAREAQRLASLVAGTSEKGAGSLADRFGEISLHPVWGIPVLLAVLLLFYLVVGRLGAGVVVDLVKTVVFDQYVNPGATWLFDFVPWAFVRELMVGQYGIVTMALTYAVAIILPVVGFFFIFFSILEDLGYLPRLAVMANETFKRIGLSGKAVLPLVLGLGCGTMAILTTRTLESKRERVLASLLLAMAIPCSAQLGVILALLAGVSPAGALVFFGILFIQLMFIGFLASKLLPGKTPPFTMEIPPIRMPHPGNVAVKTMARVGWYFKEAVPLFVLGTLILFILNWLGAMAFLQRGGAPVVRDWLGLPVEATGPFIFGFLRRDYGAAGFFNLQQLGMMTPNQVVVSLTVLTLFLPCIAQFFVMLRERGLKTAMAIAGFLLPFSVFIGGVLNFVLNTFGVRF
ncbi:MAG: ferrous iron transport protein B [Chloroflexi bacterium]|nr:ferrous iron transport protein B [Chloroflexota bacterium]